MLEVEARLEKQIKSLENILDQAELLVDKGEKDVISLGSKVTFMELPNGSTETYLIVSPAELEALASDEKISSTSPIAQQLIGHRAGDQVSVSTPGGQMTLKIIDVE